MTKQILVVDDDAILLELVCTCLEDLGNWDVITAVSGAEALHKAATHRLDAILLDVSMPDLDGFQCYEPLQTNAATQAIPIIFLTAKALMDDRDRCAQLAIAGIIIKPFDPLHLCHQVASLLNWAA
jgi:CheY-like chemotaxis protein